MNGVDNYGLDIGDHDTYGVNDHKYIDNQDMYVEISKLSRPVLDHSQSELCSQRRKSTMSELNGRIDTQSLAVKIFKEEKRRASITPYKKAYALDNMSDDDSDNWIEKNGFEKTNFW